MEKMSVRAHDVPAARRRRQTPISETHVRWRAFRRKMNNPLNHHGFSKKDHERLYFFVLPTRF